VTAAAVLEDTCPGVGGEAPPTLSETSVCPACRQRVAVLTSRVPDGPPVRTISWHLGSSRAGR